MEYIFFLVVRCLQPTGIRNGMFSPQKEFYMYNEVVRYSCNKDYTINGSKDIICEENGKFSPTPPSCVCKCFNI